jgi:hypothetical protein
MMADRPNADEGADPSEDIREQNPGETTTADLTDEGEEDEDTPGSNKQEDVEDRPNVGTVKPEDYPEEERRDQRP